MSDDGLHAKLHAFAASASPLKRQPDPAAPLSAVELATSGERLVLLDIGRTPPGRVPGSGPSNSQHDTIADAVLEHVQAHFPGTACSIKTGGSATECVVVFCFPNTPVGLRGYDWFHAQGRECRMPIPNSDITVHIPMVARVARPGNGGEHQVRVSLRNVPSMLWKQGLAALLMEHYNVPCEVTDEYAPDFRSTTGKVYKGMLHRGCIVAALKPAGECDFSKLPATLVFGGGRKPISLRVYGARTYPRAPAPRARPSSAPAAAPAAHNDGDPAVTTSASAARQGGGRNRRRRPARAGTSQGSDAVQEEVVPPPSCSDRPCPCPVPCIACCGRAG